MRTYSNAALRHTQTAHTVFPLQQVEDGVLVETKTTERWRFHLGPQTDVFQDNKGGNLRGMFFFFLQKLLFHVIESFLNFNFSTLRVISSLSGKSIGERAIKPHRCFEGAREGGDGWDSASEAFLRRLSPSLFSPPSRSVLTPRLLFCFGFFCFLQTLSSLSPPPSLRLPLPDAYHIPPA